MLAIPHRRLRQLHQLLRDKILRLGAHPRDKVRALRVGQVVTEHGLHAQLREGRLDHELVELLDRLLQRIRLAAPPGGHRGHLQVLAKQLPRQVRQEAQQRAGLKQVGAQRVCEEHIAAARGVGKPGHAKGRVSGELERVAEIVIQPAQDRVHPLQPRQRLQPDAAIAHGEVVAFDQGEAEIAREVRVLEIGFVVRSRGQQHDQGRFVVVRRPVREAIAQRREETRKVLHLEIAEQVREHARDDEPVLQRIARARGRLGAVRHHPPLPVGRSREVCGVHM